jgi:hypothetical protein
MFFDVILVEDPKSVQYSTLTIALVFSIQSTQPPKQISQTVRLLTFQSRLKPHRNHVAAELIIDIMYRQFKARFGRALAEDLDALRKCPLHFPGRKASTAASARTSGDVSYTCRRAPTRRLRRRGSCTRFNGQVVYGKATEKLGELACVPKGRGANAFPVDDAGKPAVRQD